MTLSTEQADAFAANGNPLILASVSSPVEKHVLDSWLGQLRRSNGTSAVLVHLPRGNPPLEVLTEVLEELAVDDERMVLPVCVFWASDDEGSRRHSVIELLSRRDPYRPSERRQRRIVQEEPSRVRIVAGEPASVAALRQEWMNATVADGRFDFARFVVRRAVLAVERVEYRLLGPQYKSPRLVKPEMMASARFRAGLANIPGATIERAAEVLDEMATGWSRSMIELVPAAYRQLLKRGFDPQIDYDAGQLDAMRDALNRYPAILLFSHRSNLDGMVLGVALHDNDLPRAHMFGGINMAFGPLGSLMRRAGVIFIRRSFSDDPLYKYMLKEYVGYLVEKRFNLMWSIEGTRSRTGKMLPPKLGLLSYVADAYREGRSDDILLQPVSISFDQLHEVAEYAAYARGAEKKPEGFRWLYNFVKAQGQRNYGRIYVRFPTAVSMRQYLGDPETSLCDQLDERLALQKMAFEVAWRIQRATPVNATALVSALLLATHGFALNISQMHATLQDALNYLERKQTPMTKSALLLRTLSGVRATLDAMSNDHPVSRIDGGWEPVWRISPENEHAAAFYRNSVIHAFLETSIVELALAHARNAEGDRTEAFWRQATRLRDLLKFDFYFADSASFREHIAEEMAWQEDWQSRLMTGQADDVDALLACKRPLVASAMLRTFFEAYAIVADVLRKANVDTSAKELTALAMRVGAQYVAQGKVRGNEPVSTLLFTTAQQVAADQNLFEPAPDLYDRRESFHAELRAMLRDIDHVEQLSRDQVVHAGGG